MKNISQKKQENVVKIFMSTMVLSGMMLIFSYCPAWSFYYNPNHSPVTPLTAGKQVFQTWTSGANTWEYLVWLPWDYGKDPNKKWPMILFTAAAGATSKNASSEQVLYKGWSGPSMYLQTGYEYDPHNFPYISNNFIFVTLWISFDDFQPCWSQTQTDPNYKAYFPPLLQHMFATTSVDSNRVHFWGECGGSSVMYRAAWMFPQYPASMVLWTLNDPTNGCCDTTKACLLKNIPMKIIHGIKDPYCPWVRAELVANKIKACGNTQCEFIKNDAGHESWFFASSYTDKDSTLYKWALQQVKTASTAVRPELNHQNSAMSHNGLLDFALSINDRIEVIDLRGQVVSIGNGPALSRMLPKMGRGIHMLRVSGKNASAVRIMTAK